MAESLKGRALKLLARREHSRAELARKLAAHADTPEEVERVLEECASHGWLSEQRAAEQLVHSRRSRYGAKRIERDLRRKGVAGDVVTAAMADLKGSELEAARGVWRRKFGGRLARTPAERARQARFLQGRGFDLELIMKIVKGEGDEQ